MEVLGPLAITSLRERALHQALHELAGKVSPDAFAAKFGAPLEELPLLIEKNTVTLARLLEIAPPGTPNPSNGLYDSTMYLMAGLLAVAFVANASIRPVHEKHYLPE